MRKFLHSLSLPAKITGVLYFVFFFAVFADTLKGSSISTAIGLLIFFVFTGAVLLAAVQLLTIFIKWLIDLSHKVDTSQAQEKTKEFLAEAVKPASQKMAEIQAERESLTATREELQQDIENSKDQQAKLKAYAAEIDKRESATKQRLEEQTLKARKEIAAERRKLDERLEQLHEYESALHRTEYQVLKWVQLKESNDIAYFEEMQSYFEKYKTFSEQIPQMDGFQFEEYIGKLLIDNGYTEVEVTQKTQDFGADVVATFGNAKYVFQCKYYTHPVGIEAVQQIYSAKSHYSAHVAVVVTNSVFTKAARILADEIGVLLWDGETINNMSHHTE